MDIENLYDDKNLKVVISPVLAAKLCNIYHYPIVKLRKKRIINSNNDCGCDTVFLFEATVDFLRDFYELTNKKEQN
jgi:hypothetical protein